MKEEAPTHPSAERLPLWRRIDLGRCDPIRAQAFAESVAESVATGESPNTLLFAQPASPYISLGFHQSLDEELDPGLLGRGMVPVIRRVEGGGTTWLDPDQWFYQLVYREEEGGIGGPSDLSKFLVAPARAARRLGLAVGWRAPSDLVVGDRKISGNAGGDWAGAHLLVGGFLGRVDSRAMASLFRIPHPAIRPLIQREVERWVTSWEIEQGGLPNWEALRDQVVEEFRTHGLFRTRRGPPTVSEETRFRSETIPRHGDRTWREAPLRPRASSLLRRRIRVAGPHGICVFAEADSRRLRVAVVDGSDVREGYLLDPGPAAQPRRLAADSPESKELKASVRGVQPFD